MKAAVLEKYGEDEHFQIKEVETPVIKDGEILIENKASSINPVDADIWKGKMRFSSGLFGEHVIGTDFAGVVKESKSNRFQPGDEVFGFKLATDGHTFASMVAADANNAVLKPAYISFTDAASLALVSTTAYQALFQYGNLKEGQKVLINGCSGGVGSAAVQIAKAYGIHVTGTCSGDNINIAKELGCDEVINYETETIPADHSFDLFLDCAAKYTLTDIEDSLTENGLMVTVRPNTKDFKTAVSSGIDLLKSRMKVFFAKSNAEDLTIIKQLIENGKLKPFVAKVFPLAQIDEAIKMLEDGDFAGKVTIEI